MRFWCFCAPGSSVSAVSLLSVTRKAVLARLAAVGFLALACEAVTPNFTWDDSLLRNGICQEGFLRCFGAGLYACNHDLTGWSLVKQCASEQQCDSAGGRCTVCGVGERRCTSTGDLQLCRADRSDWDPNPLRRCGSSGCNADLESCGACPEGRYQCDENGLLSLCVAGKWAAAKNCGSVDNCAVDLNGACRSESGCTKGSWDCQGSVLRQCDGTTWHAMQTCKSDKLCTASLATLTSNPPQDPSAILLCKPPACAENTFNCKGNTVQVCKDRDWVDSKVCSGSACNPETGNCEPCVEGHYACSGATLSHCESGSWKAQLCASDALCNASKGQCEPPCRRSAKARCLDISAVSFCNDELVFENVQCVRQDLCVVSDLRCEPPECEQKAVRCNGETLQVCDPTWKDQTACASGTHCSLDNGGSCVASTCKAGSYRCNDVFLEQCDAQGVFQRVDRCVAPSACLVDSGKCEPGCLPDTRRCNPTDPMRVDRCQFDHTWSTATSYICDSPCDPTIGDCSH